MTKVKLIVDINGCPARDMRVLNYVVIPLEVRMRPLLRARRLYLSISCLPRLKNKTILFLSVNVSRI